MTARTSVAQTAIVRDGAVPAIGAGVSGAATMTVPSPGPYKLLLMVTNGGVGASVATLRARNNGTNAAGAAQSGNYQPMAQASEGDLVQSIAAGATALFWPETTSRFAQADGSLSLDLSVITSVKVWALQLPYVAR